MSHLSRILSREKVADRAIERVKIIAKIMSNPENKKEECQHEIESNMCEPYCRKCLMRYPSEVKPSNGEEWEKEFDKEYNWFAQVKITPREAGDYKQAELLNSYYRATGERLKDFIRQTLSHSKTLILEEVENEFFKLADMYLLDTKIGEGKIILNKQQFVTLLLDGVIKEGK
jgi:hypothetical protein